MENKNLSRSMLLFLSILFVSKSALALRDCRQIYSKFTSIDDNPSIIEINYNQITTDASENVSEAVLKSGAIKNKNNNNNYQDQNNKNKKINSRLKEISSKREDFDNPIQSGSRNESVYETDRELPEYLSRFFGFVLPQRLTSISLLREILKLKGHQVIRSLSILALVQVGF